MVKKLSPTNFAKYLEKNQKKIRDQLLLGGTEGDIYLAENCNTLVEVIPRLNPLTRKKNINYICKWKDCNKKEEKKYALVNHLRSHLKIKPFQCKICKNRLPTSSSYDSLTESDRFSRALNFGEYWSRHVLDGTTSDVQCL